MKPLGTLNLAGKIKNWQLSAYSWLIIFFGVLLLGSQCFYVCRHINNEYDRTLAEISRETMNLAQAFEEHVRSVIVDADRDLLSLKHIYEMEGSNASFFNKYMSHIQQDSIRSISFVLNEQGVVVASSMQDAIAENFSYRDYFLFHRQMDSEAMNIGQPFHGRLSKQNIIPLSRRINKPDGSFGGVVFIGLRTDYFTDFYNKLELGPDKLISVGGLDGVIRARQENDNLENGQNVSQTELHRLALLETQGTLVAASRVDGIRRVRSYRVMTDYPLIVLVGVSTEAAFAAFEQYKKNAILGLILASLFIVGMCALLIERTQALAKKNTELTAIFGSITDSFYVLDNEWRFIHINKTASTACARLTQDNVGINIWEIVPELIGAELYQKYHEARATNAPIQMIHKSFFSEKWFDRTIYPYDDGLVVYFKDITEQRKIEQEMSRLDRLNIVGEMAAGIGHEIRNPLTTVRGYLQMFQLKKDFVLYQEQLGTMIEELDRANSIITEYLSLAKNKAVKLTIGNVSNTINALFPLMQADAFSHNHKLQMRISETPSIQFDEKELRQLLLNLVRNAFEAMKPGGTVTIKNYFENDKIVLAVQDTGTGIPEEVLLRLGTPFVTTKDSGTGLGLAVCYRIAARHNAEIDITSSAEGTTVFVRFRLDMG